MANALSRRPVIFVIFTVVLGTANSWGADLIPFESNWLYLHPNGPSENPSTADTDFDTTWFRSNYNTSSPTAWSGPAPGPFSRGGITVFDPGTRFVREANTLLADRDSGNRLTAYFRHDFTTTEPTSGFALELLADDGAKIYLDGNEILSFNCCANAGPGQPASYDDTSIAPGVEIRYSKVRVLQGQSLAAGNHVLAVAVHNRTATDSDLGFSLNFTEGLVDFVNSGEKWQYFEGFDEPSNGTLDWTHANFDDSSWDSGKEAFGYEETAVGDPTGVFDMVDAGTLLDMQDSFTSLYLRKQFTASQLDELSELTLTMDYDDAFFAYINGKLVFSSELTHPMGDASLPIPFDLDGAAAGFDHESSNNSATLPDEFTVRLADFPGLLNEGDNNVLAIQGFNRAPDSSDFLMAKIALFGSPGSGSPTVPGDFDGDGALTASDIDQLTDEVRKGTNNLFFDVTGNGVVDEEDRAEWVDVLRFTYFGDSNLDGEFNTADLVVVLTAGEYEDDTAINSGWATGDWNGDGDFTTADFVTALSAGGYELGPRTAVAAVPEPSSVVLLQLAVLVGGTALRRRSRPRCSRR